MKGCESSFSAGGRSYGFFCRHWRQKSRNSSLNWPAGGRGMSSFRTCRQAGDRGGGSRRQVGEM